jgi:hypothetical protein
MCGVRHSLKELERSKTDRAKMSLSKILPKSSSVWAAAGISAAAAAAALYFKRRSELNEERVKRMFSDRIDSSSDCIRITVVESEQQFKSIEAELISYLESNPIVGFDCEWVGEKKISLIQLATTDGWCVLVRLSKTMVVPKGLYPILADPKVIKLGVAIQDDAKKLKDNFGLSVSGWFDLRHLISEHRPKMTRMGLAGMAEAFLDVAMDKDVRVRTSDWEADMLSSRQMLYAANDALISMNVVLQVAMEAVETRRRFGWAAVSSVEELAGVAAAEISATARVGLEFRIKGKKELRREKRLKLSGRRRCDKRICRLKSWCCWNSWRYKRGRKVFL